MSADRNSDPWQDPLAGIDPGNRQIAIRMVTFDTPLDAQIGVEPKRCVPAGLEPLIFGQPPASAREREIAGPGPLPPMLSYALLDAAKVPNLADLLAGSGLEHRCLFKGEPAETLRDVAPWLVRLEPEARFTRNLFTAGKMPGALWDRRPGVLIRSRAEFQPLWAFLRKFTRLQDEAGKWFYFRFWEPDYLEAAQPILDELAGKIRRDALWPATLIGFHPGAAAGG